MSLVSTITARIAGRLDGWQNLLTGFGTTARDKTTSGYFYRESRIPDDELTSLYIGDDMAARIIDVVPQEMFRAGFEVVAGEATAEADALEDWCRKLDITRGFREATRWARLYGGSALVLGVDDGGNADEPLNLATIRGVLPSPVVDRRWIWPVSYYRDPLRYGMPEKYQIVTWGAGPGVQNVTIHESRLITFPGVPTPHDKKVELQGWDYSVLQRCYRPLRQFESNFKSLEIMLAEASQAVYGVKGLWQIIAQGEEAKLTARMQIVEMARSVARAIVIDKDEESFTKHTTSFAGVPDSIDKTIFRLAAASQIPVSLLIGQPISGGLFGASANGDDLRGFYERIQSEQVDTIKPRLLRHLTLLCLAKDGPTGGKLLPGLDVTFHNLRVPTDKERSEIRKLTADTDAVYLDREVVLPEEIARSRFGVSGWSAETSIDLEARERALTVAPDAPDAPDAPETVAVASTPLTATDWAYIITVNEARQSIKLGSVPGGTVSVAEFKLAQEAKYAPEEIKPSNSE